jgi:hypothetical protein
MNKTSKKKQKNPRSSSEKKEKTNKQIMSVKEVVTIRHNPPYDTQRVYRKRHPGRIHGEKMVAHARSQAKMRKDGTMIATLDRVRGPKGQLFQWSIAFILGGS